VVKWEIKRWSVFGRSVLNETQTVAILIEGSPISGHLTERRIHHAYAISGRRNSFRRVRTRSVRIHMLGLSRAWIPGDSGAIRFRKPPGGRALPKTRDC
jgi:hypothetical protein